MPGIDLGIENLYSLLLSGSASFLHAVVISHNNLKSKLYHPHIDYCSPLPRVWLTNLLGRAVAFLHCATLTGFWF